MGPARVASELTASTAFPPAASGCYARIVSGGFVIGGKYHTVRLIGEGGMGAVYDAIHSKTGRRVAIKIIHEQAVAHGGVARLRFDREAKAAAAVESLHVVQVLDSGEDETSGMPFIVMEYLQGNDLRALIERGRVPPPLAIAIALQTCRGLQKAHAAGVLHRDLKPANVFLAKADGDRRIVKLLDFGIAKLLDDDAPPITTDLTSTGEVVGSPPYMSPEQLRAPRDVDRRTDVWSMGVLLYEMLCGHTPTARVNPIGARVYAICHTPSPPIRGLVPDVSEELAAIVHKALAIDLAERFEDVDALFEALRALAPAGDDISEADVSLPSRSTEVGVVNDTVLTSMTSATTVNGPILADSTQVMPPPMPSRSPPRSMLPVAIGASLLALALLAAGVLGIQRLAEKPEKLEPSLVSAPAPEATATPAPPASLASPAASASTTIVAAPVEEAASAPVRPSKPTRKPASTVTAPRPKPRPAATTRDGRDEL